MTGIDADAELGKPVTEPTTRTIRFRVNGEVQVLDNPNPTHRLVDYLRDIGLTGTKIGCGEGGCGACTVMMTRSVSGRPTQHRPINACLRPLCSVDGAAITTVEGIGDARTGLHPIQYAVAMNNGTQCGFCTPGFVMSMYSLLQDNPKPTPQTVEDHFDGNLCRCTGFRPILQAMQTFAEGGGGFRGTDGPVLKPLPANVTVHVPRFVLMDPPAIALDPNIMLEAHGNGVQWYRPTTLAQAQSLKEQFGGYPSARLVGANTSTGVYPQSNQDAKVRIDISRLPELSTISMTTSSLEIGSGVAFQDLIEFLEQQPTGATGIRGMLPLLRRTASSQIRSVATVGGNLMLVLEHAVEGMAFVSDLFTALLAFDATITIASRQFNGMRTYGITEVPPIEEWPPDSVLVAISVPLSTSGDYVVPHKVAARPQLAHAIVNMMLRVRINTEGVVTAAAIATGGIARVARRAPSTEAVLVGQVWSMQLHDRAAPAFAREMQDVIAPMPDEGFSDAYRLSLAESLFYKSILAVTCEVAPGEVGQRDRSAGTSDPRPISSGRQEFLDSGKDSVGEPFTKFTAFTQTTGEAMYTYDIAHPANTLHGAFITSRYAKATYTWRKPIDDLISELQATTPGFRSLITMRDVPVLPSGNIIGNDAFDLVFAQSTNTDGEVTWYGQPIALVVADNSARALAIAETLGGTAFTYTPSTPVITIDQALSTTGGIFESPSPLFATINDIVRPGSDAGWLADPNATIPGTAQATGKQVSGAQAQFYMEPQAVLVVPEGGTGVSVFVAAQDAALVQSSVSAALGITSSDVRVHVNLVGGGFGGKTTRVPFMAVPIAVAAWKLRRPVRLAITRQVDLTVIGKRHPYQSTYRAAYEPDGRIVALDGALVADGGNSYDCSFYVMNEGLSQGDGAYNVPTFHLGGKVARTNTASNNAMRGFGVPQTLLMLEDAVEQVAHQLNMRAEDVRFRNLYSAGDRIPRINGQVLVDCDLRELWPQLLVKWDINARRDAIATFNANNRWRKRGLCMMPVKYGVSYGAKLLDQGGALINVYAADGSVLVQSGGIEMGQGLQTKMIQITAQELKIDISHVRIAETDPTAVPNASSTGASTGSDLNGGAVRAAAKKLYERLVEYRDKKLEGNPSLQPKLSDWAKDWPLLISMAWMDRVDLSSHAFFKTPGLSDATPFYYLTYSASASEVEIDVLTGESMVVRADLLYDAGNPLNPAIDLGQVEGGYVQGLGMMTSEQIKYNDAGELLTKSTWTYKPPSSHSIPIDFRVELRNRLHTDFEGKAVPSAVYSSKSSGEPPLVLAASAFFAIKEAILAARADQGAHEWFQLDAPATVERIQQSCNIAP